MAETQKQYCCRGGFETRPPFERAGLKPAPTNHHGLPEVVRALKTFSARKINQIRNSIGISVWQRNYYEHVIRNEKELNKLREYIVDNPLQWYCDEYF
jgi:putative transposase